MPRAKKTNQVAARTVGSLRLVDVINPLATLAAQALDDPYGCGMKLLRAGMPVVVDEPGTRVDVSGGFVIGKNMKGRVRDGAFVVDLGRGKFDAHDSVIVGDRVRVRSRGKTAVVGKKARVFSRTPSSTPAIDSKKSSQGSSKQRALCLAPSVPPKKRRPH